MHNARIEQEGASIAMLTQAIQAMPITRDIITNISTTGMGQENNFTQGTTGSTGIMMCITAVQVGTTGRTEAIDK